MGSTICVQFWLLSASSTLTLSAKEIHLRAGTLLDCTLQEPSWHRLKAGRDLNNALAEFQRDSTIDPSFAVAAPEAKVVQS